MIDPPVAVLSDGSVKIARSAIIGGPGPRRIGPFMSKHGLDMIVAEAVSPLKARDREVDGHSGMDGPSQRPIR